MKQLFFIAVIPDTETRDEITAFKNDFKKNFESGQALKTPPHITLVPPFTMDETALPELRAALSQRAKSFENFTVLLDGFAAFAPRVIYINVKKSNELTNVYYALQELMNSGFQIESKDHGRKFSPHITIAFKDLTNENFYKGWDKYKSRTYKRGFHIDRLYLLIHRNRQWEIFDEFMMSHKAT